MSPTDNSTQVSTGSQAPAGLGGKSGGRSRWHFLLFEDALGDRRRSEAWGFGSLLGTEVCQRIIIPLSGSSWPAGFLLWTVLTMCHVTERLCHFRAAAYTPLHIWDDCIGVAKAILTNPLEFAFSILQGGCSPAVCLYFPVIFVAHDQWVACTDIIVTTSSKLSPRRAFPGHKCPLSSPIALKRCQGLTNHWLWRDESPLANCPSLGLRQPSPDHKPTHFKGAGPLPGGPAWTSCSLIFDPHYSWHTSLLLGWTLS